MSGPRHQCMVLEGAPSKQFHRLAPLIVEKLKSNHRCFYANDPEMAAGMRAYLDANGFLVAHEVERGALVFGTQQSHLIEGHFDPNRVLSMVEAIIEQAAQDGFDGLWGCGDIGWELGS